MQKSVQSLTASSIQEQHRDYLRIRDAIHFVAAHRLDQPSLEELSKYLHLSEYHLQRLFTRWAGVSPKSFLQYLTKEHAKRMLRQHSVNECALAVGLSGPSRLHDLMISCESVTPGEYQSMGQNLGISWGFHPTPFGQCLLAATLRGVCFLAFFDTEDQRSDVMHDLRAEWSKAMLVEDLQTTQVWIERIFQPVRSVGQPLSVVLKGSPFQLKVWEALLHIQDGEVCTYADVATSIGQPNATRAVASAIAKNQIGYLIPCHRVIRSTGESSGYRWGFERKQAILAREYAERLHRLEPQGR